MSFKFRLESGTCTALQLRIWNLNSDLGSSQGYTYRVTTYSCVILGKVFNFAKVLAAHLENKD